MLPSEASWRPRPPLDGENSDCDENGSSSSKSKSKSMSIADADAWAEIINVIRNVVKSEVNTSDIVNVNVDASSDDGPPGPPFVPEPEVSITNS